MDELGTRLAELAEEVANGARVRGAAAARRRGRRRRRAQAGGVALLAVALVAAVAGLDRWAGHGGALEPAGPGDPPRPPRTAEGGWRPFEPDGIAFRPTGPPVLVTEGETDGDRWRLYAYPAVERRTGTRSICLAEQQPGGGGGGTCQDEAAPVTVGASGIGDPRRLLTGQVTRRAAKVRLELAGFGRDVAPVEVEPLPGKGLPVDFWAVALPKTVEVRWVVAVDAAGAELARHRGHPADYNLEPAGPVTELTQVPSPLGRLRLQVYQAEQGITCMRVIPVADPGGGLQECMPPTSRPPLEVFASCHSGVGLLRGTAPRDADAIRVRSDRAGPAATIPADAGATFGRSYWVVAVPDGATGLRVEAVRDGRVVASTRADTYLQPLCGPP